MECGRTAAGSSGLCAHSAGKAAGGMAGCEAGKGADRCDVLQFEQTGSGYGRSHSRNSQYPVNPDGFFERNSFRRLGGTKTDRFGSYGFCEAFCILEQAAYLCSYYRGRNVCSVIRKGYSGVNGTYCCPPGPIMVKTKRGTFELFSAGQGKPLCVTHFYSAFTDKGNYFADLFAERSCSPANMTLK